MGGGWGVGCGGWGVGAVPAGGGGGGQDCGRLARVDQRIAGHTRGRMAGGDGGGGGDRKVQPRPPRARSPTQIPGNSRPEVPSAGAARPGSL